ncbi:PREDICTED: olfactory receptor 5B12-like [Nanorana parkeri]|uniref:olfactory receptor 5B12-like n=1 Tax=Nanorana parkeri TaxID=125878 RepID=UPI0008548B28|nr:PREDICTED: olfactory receptor 5B12-like [Nanorana parkeri]
MGNQTILNELFLSGLSDIPALQLPLFLFFLLIYLLTLIWNLLIISLIVSDSHLHTPMYFFLGNLASLDLFCSSVTVPRMLFDLLTQRRKITKTACITQVFFFLFFAISEVFLLAVMSYDRYTAICRPLHYIQIMSWKVCVQLASIVWGLGSSYSLVQTLCALHLTFCESAIIESFFCDLPPLLQISCSDIYINILLIFVLGGFLGVGSLTLTIFPYVSIFKTVLKIQVKGKRSKVFLTCSSHLTVVFIFYCSTVFNYFRPKTYNHFAADKVVSVFYTVIVPLLNPLIYSLRNKDLRTAFQSVFLGISSKQNTEIILAKP